VAAAGGIAVVAVAIGALLAGKEGDRKRLETLLDRLEAEGWGRSVEDLMAEAPEVDAERQEAAWRWMRIERHDSNLGSASNWEWFLEGRDGPPQTAIAWLEAFRSDAEELATLLRQGPLHLTSLGWIPLDRARLADQGGRNEAPRIPSLLRVRAVVDWFGLAALVGHDRERHLESLASLSSALVRPATLIDSILDQVVASRRDFVYLSLALQGQLDAARLDSWAAEPSRAFRRSANALRGERLLWLGPLAEDLVAGRSIADRFPSSAPDSLDDLGRLWDREASGPLRWSDDCARVLEAWTLFEGHLRGEVESEPFLAAHRAAQEVGWPFHPMIGLGPQWVAGCLSEDIRHRAVRAAAIVATGRSNTPEDAARLAQLTDPGPWGAGLEVQRPSANEIRVVLRSDAPLPAILDEGTRSSFAVPRPSEKPVRGGIQDLPNGIRVRLPRRAVRRRGCDPPRA
jgi:hypothetical protein